MKEIKCQKYSLVWFTKRNKRRYIIIIALIIILFLALPIVFGVITHRLELFSIYAVSPIVLLFFILYGTSIKPKTTNVNISIGIILWYINKGSKMIRKIRNG